MARVHVRVSLALWAIGMPERHTPGRGPFFAIALLTETSRGRSTVFASARTGHHASRRLLGLAITRRSRAAALLTPPPAIFLFMASRVNGLD